MTGRIVLTAVCLSVVLVAGILGFYWADTVRLEAEIYDDEFEIYDDEINWRTLSTIQNRFVRIENETFSRQSMQTGDILTVQGRLVSDAVGRDLRGWVSIFAEPTDGGHGWELISSFPPGVFNIAANSVVPYSVSVRALDGGVYHIHTLLDLEGISPGLGPGATIVVDGEPITRPAQEVKPDASTTTTPTQGSTQITVDEYEKPFVTTWRVDAVGGNATILVGGVLIPVGGVSEWNRDLIQKMGDGKVTIPVGDATGTYTISWGDGTFDVDVSGDQHHTYTESGDYTISIYGDFTRIYLDGQPNAQKLLSIDQWGDMQWESMASAFNGASNMIYNASDSPDLSAVTNMSQMFAGAATFNGDLSAWDVSSVTDMSGMFAGAATFNGDLSAWDVSSVTDMSWMFAYIPTFNGDLSAWDVSSVTDMSWMFAYILTFNGDLSAWDVSSVTDMSGMFAYIPTFNGDLSAWDVSSVTDMVGMFWDSTFNGDLSAWDVSSVTNMTMMFDNAASFDQNLGSWYVNINNTSIEREDVPGVVGTIYAKNIFLAGQNPTYVIEPGGDSDRFTITDGNLLRMVSVVTDQTIYAVTITATGDSVFEDGNNRQDIQVTLKDGGQ